MTGDHTMTGRLLLCHGLIAVALLGACTQEITSEIPGVEGEGVDGKTDGWLSNAFPQASDLALVVPLDDAQIRAIDLIPGAWLAAVDEALYASELGESIALENVEEEWRLELDVYISIVHNAQRHIPVQNEL